MPVLVVGPSRRAALAGSRESGRARVLTLSAWALACSVLVACGDDESGDGPGPGSLTAAGGTDGADDGGTRGGDTDDASSGSDDADDADDDGTGDAADAGTSGDGDTGGPDGDATLQFLVVDPTNAIVELDLGQSTSLPLSVLGHYDDGSIVDVTEAVAWETSEPSAGALGIGPAGTSFDAAAHDEVFFATTVLTASLDGVEGLSQITVAAYRMDADFFFVLPFEDRAGPQAQLLSFGTEVSQLDVFFNMDTSGSMGGPIGNLQASLLGIVMPGIEAQVPDTWLGAGGFEDFPVAPFGNPQCTFGASESDQPFALLAPITDDAETIQNGVNAMTFDNQPAGCGGDWPEAHLEALHQIATGSGLDGPGATDVPPGPEGVGGVGFRDGAMPVIVSVTDAPSHNPDDEGCEDEWQGGYSQEPGVLAAAHGEQETLDALAEICGRVVSVAVDPPSVIGPPGPDCGAPADGRRLAEGTGARIPPVAWDFAEGGRPPGCAADQCCTSYAGAGEMPDADGQCPLVYHVDDDGFGLGLSVVDGIRMLAAYAPFDVTTALEGVSHDVTGEIALPRPHQTDDFILSVTPDGHGPIPLPGVEPPVMTPEGFDGVIPDTEVTFLVTAFNDFAEPADEAQLFTATISVLADDCSDLDARQVLILVPPVPLTPAG